MDNFKIALLVLLAVIIILQLIALFNKNSIAELETAFDLLKRDSEQQQQALLEQIERLNRNNLELMNQLNKSNTASLEMLAKLLKEKQEESALAQRQTLAANMENISKAHDQLKSNVIEQIVLLRTGQSNQMELFNRQVTEKLTDLEARVQHIEATNEKRLEVIRGVVEQRLEEMRTDNNAKLDIIRGTVDEKLQTTLENRITSSFKTVTEELKRVYEGLGEMKKLASGVDSLKKILGNVKTRGILGEVQLGSILEEILAPEQYEENVITVKGTNNRVEYAIHLPGADGNSVYLPIDAKFPGDLYSYLQEVKDNGSKEEIEAAYKALENRVRQEAKDIHMKYIAPPDTTEFGILFLPFEGLYAEVVSRGMLQELQNNYQVTITGPSTMAAYLNSLRMGFRTLAIQKRSNEVWKILGAVKTEFGKFQTGLLAMKGHLDTTSKDLDKLMTTRTNVMNRKLQDVENLDYKETKKWLDIDEESDT